MDWGPIIAAGIVSLVVGGVGKLAGGKLDAIDKKIDDLFNGRGEDRTRITRVEARADEAHRRMDDHMERCHAPRRRK